MAKYFVGSDLQDMYTCQLPSLTINNLKYLYTWKLMVNDGD